MDQLTRRIRDNRIEALFRAGETHARIAAAVGLTRERVTEILKDRGVPRASGGASQRAARKKVNRLALRS